MLADDWDATDVNAAIAADFEAVDRPAEAVDGQSGGAGAGRGTEERTTLLVREDTLPPSSPTTGEDGRRSASHFEPMIRPLFGRDGQMPQQRV